MLAKRHNLVDEAAEILHLAQKDQQDVPELKSEGVLMVPPKPISRSQDTVWPLLPMSQGIFESPSPQTKINGVPAPENGIAKVMTESIGDWGGDEDLLVSVQPQKPVELSASAVMDLDGAWGIDNDDLMADLPVTTPVAPQSTSSGGSFVIPVPGPTPTDHWCRTSQLVSDHVAAGSFETAMQVETIIENASR